MSIMDELAWRGLIYQQTDEVGLQKYLETGKLTIYVGFDPTADSLHIGHLVPYLTLQRFVEAGHKVIVLVGGATGRIGDPSGRSDERNLLSDEEITANTQAVQKQVQQILHSNDFIFENNYHWLKDMTLLELLRDYGKHMNINVMLSRDSVQSRLAHGISFTEFSYQLIQGVDFYHLYKEYGCNVQAGGADQWGNIVSGTDLIRKITDGAATVFGLTFPLIKKSDGTKFGKTASGAIWLSAKKTSPYEFYQFWINTTDADIIHYLKVFSPLSQTEIALYEQQVETEPHHRAAQKYLSEYMTTLIHGAPACTQALKMTQALFTGDIAALSLSELEDAFKDGPTFELTEPCNILDALVTFNIVSSKRQARELLDNGAIRVNGEQITDANVVLSKDGAIEGQISIIRKGKKMYYVCKHV